MYCPPCRHAGDVQAACHLPRDAIRLRREVVDPDHDQLGLRGPSLGEPDHLVADLRDNPGKIAALPGRKGRGKDVSHRPGSDGRLTRVDACRFDPDEDLLVPGNWAVDLVDPQDLDSAELVVSDGLHCHASPPTRDARLTSRTNMVATGARVTRAPFPRR